MLEDDRSDIIIRQFLVGFGVLAMMGDVGVGGMDRDEGGDLTRPGLRGHDGAARPDARSTVPAISTESARPRPRETLADGSPPVDRQPIVDAIRRMMMSRPKFALQRRQLAALAGVPPASITRHFPKQSDLVVEATEPLLAQYVERVSAIIDDQKSDMERLQALIRLFVEFSYETGYMLEAYIDEMTDTGDEAAMKRLASSYMKICSFMSQIVGRYGPGTIDGPFLQTMIWGSCKSVAGQPHLQSQNKDGEKSVLMDSIVEKIFHVVVRGALPLFSDVEGSILKSSAE